MPVSLALVLAASTVAQPASTPPLFREFAPKVTYYYKSPDPELGPKMLQALLQKENIEHPWFATNGHVLLLIGAQLGDIASGKPKIVREYESAFAGAPLAGRRVIVRALTNCGDATTIKTISGWLSDDKFADIRPELESLKKDLEDPKRKHLRDRAAQSPDDLDFLWSNFFITGEYAPISRILDVLDLPANRDNALMKRVARWSLESNLNQHPKLVELVQKHAPERKGGSRDAINDLAPSKASLEKMTARVVGKWVSEDNQKLPLEFLKDGTAKVGFIKENGVWLIATGTFTVSGNGTIRSRTVYQGSTLTQSWRLKDGALVGSSGPRPIVKWVKVEEQRK
jgi:uncharacterized protein (TIGR03066 family)